MSDANERVPVIDEPRAGYYSCRLVKGGLRVAVRIWHGAPIIDGEVQDRSHRWCVEVNGETDKPVLDYVGNVVGRAPLDAFDWWPLCCGHPINQDEYKFLLRRRAWAVEHEPQHPAARPRQRIDVAKLKPGW